MKILSDILESSSIIINIDKDDLKKYINIVKKDVNRDTNALLNYLYDYNILSSVTLDDIKNKSNLSELSKKYNIPETIIKSIKKLNYDECDIPLYQDSNDFQSILDNTKTLEDITLDLNSPRSRDKIAKKYIPLVQQIARKYTKSGFNFADLVSAGMEGLTLAMNDYNKNYFDGTVNKEEATKYKQLTFRQYAGWRIQQKILNEIQANSRTVKMSKHMTDKVEKAGGPLYTTVSIDARNFDTDGESTGFMDNLSNMLYMRNSGDISSIRQKEIDDLWTKIFNILDKKFSNKKINNLKIFLMRRGLNGYNKENSKGDLKGFSTKEIQDKLGVKTSASQMSQLDKSIINYLSNNKETRKILNDIRDLYIESLISDNIKSNIFETLLNDETYLYLEDLTRLNDIDSFDNIIGTTINEFSYEDSKVLESCLTNEIDYIDNIYDEYKYLLLEFVSKINPTKIYNDDLSIINEVANISNLYKEYHR